jgi:hypothetical protein
MGEWAGSVKQRTERGEVGGMLQINGTHTPQTVSECEPFVTATPQVSPGCSACMVHCTRTAPAWVMSAARRTYGHYMCAVHACIAQLVLSRSCHTLNINV